MQIRATEGQARASACQYDQALVLIDEAIAVKNSHRSGRRPAVGLAYTLACRGAILGDYGEFARAIAVFDDAVEAIAGAKHEVEGSVLALRSAVLLWQGEWQQAAACAHAGAGIGSRVRSLYVHAMCTALGGFANWKLSGNEEHLQAIVNATHWLEHRGKALFTSLNYGWLTEAEVERGNPEAARRYADLALQRAARRDRLGEAMTCRALARLADVHSDEADKWLDAADTAATLRGSHHEKIRNDLARAEVLIARGDHRAASTLRTEATQRQSALAMRDG